MGADSPASIIIRKMSEKAHMHDIHGMEGESCRAGLKFQISARPESETAAGSRLLRAPRPHGRGDTFSRLHGRLSGCVCLGRSGLSVRVVCILMW